MFQSGHPTRVLLVGGTGRTALSDLQNERYPDLQAENFDAYARRARQLTCHRHSTT